MTALLLAVLAASLLGSLHCVGMCGGLVAVVAAARGPCAPPRGRLGDQLTYHAGRGLSYALVGALMGALGAGVDRLGAVGGLQRVAATAAGAGMLLWGAGALLSWRGLLPALPSLPGGRALARAFAWSARLGPRGRALLTGALTPLLPCGWLWLFAATAAGTGSALGGLAVMVAFWAGTVPALFGLGLGLGLGAGALSLRRHLPWIRGATLVVVGLLTLSGRATLSLAPPRPAPTTSPADALERVQAAPAAALPCCSQEEGAAHEP